MSNYILNINKGVATTTPQVVGRVADLPKNPIYVKLKDGDDKVDLNLATVEFRGVTSSGQKLIVKSGVIITNKTNGEFRFTFPKGFYSSPGTFKRAYFVIKRDQHVDTTQDLMVHVIEDVDVNADDAEHIFEGLDKVVAQLEKQIKEDTQRLIQQIKNDTASTIADSNKKLSELEKQTNDFKNNTNQTIISINNQISNLNNSVDSTNVKMSDLQKQLDKLSNDINNKDLVTVGRVFNQVNSPFNLSDESSNFTRIPPSVEHYANPVSMELYRGTIELSPTQPNDRVFLGDKIPIGDKKKVTLSGVLQIIGDRQTSIGVGGKYLGTVGGGSGESGSIDEVKTPLTYLRDGLYHFTQTFEIDDKGQNGTRENYRLYIYPYVGDGVKVRIVNFTNTVGELSPGYNISQNDLIDPFYKPNLVINSNEREWIPMNGAVLKHNRDVRVPEWGATDAMNVSGKPGNSQTVMVMGTLGELISENHTPYNHSIYIKNNSDNPITISNSLGKSYTVSKYESTRVVMNGFGNGRIILQFVVSATDLNRSIDFDYWHPQITKSIEVLPWRLSPHDIATNVEIKSLQSQIDELSKMVTALGGS